MRVAVVKPDHLGDMVLASPAIRAIVSRYPDATLFVASRTQPLAEYLFPDTRICSLDLPHLDKFRTRNGSNEQAITNLLEFDLVYFLRQDGVLTPNWAKLVARRSVIVRDCQSTHETQLEAEVVRAGGIPYEPPDAFPGIALFPKHPKRVGLCISAGFYANRWITVKWVELGKLLQQRGVEVVLVAGPSEIAEARTIVRLLKLDPAQSLIIGSSDFEGFLGKIRKLDLIVATDSGTAHICSLATPILSLFGGSPFRRFAPFGRQNRLLTRSLPCSPCCQYAEALLNLCVTTECLTQISSASVIEAIYASSESCGIQKDLAADPPVKLFFGVSHSRPEQFAIIC